MGQLYLFVNANQTEYLNFQYRFDYFSIYAILSALYSIPSFIIIFKMIKFYIFDFKTSSETIKSEIFASFLVMQFFLLFSLISEFLIFRIPVTSVLTPWCASGNRENVIKYWIFFYFFSFALRELSTVFFFLLRALYLFNKENLARIVFRMSLILSFIWSFALSFPRLSDPSACVQLPYPYSFGSLGISADIETETASAPRRVGHFVLAVIFFVLVILNVMVFAKIRERKELASSLNRNYDVKAERTLKATMMLVITPIIITYLMIIGETFGYNVACVLDSLFQIFLDARAHVVTLYFYFTHPMFKKK
ncbi:hypothetical protein CRE_28342 [Caenorhabditis remanei]|uniref:G-protein coupled receptors family 1 profile domain-containing protein n=1 Tax=Caenorhabditis remanei TaxID=31234 RepID=E3LND2_CAERE|nr:hypothetical protein CRE_28342 [Caenorhabditis remanei]